MEATTVILALDLATSTGWAIADSKGKILCSGTRVLDGEDHQKLGLLLDWLEHRDDFHFRAVVIESPWVRGNNTKFLMGLRGVAAAYAGTQGAGFHEYAPATVKKAVTGDGHASKGTVRKFVERLTGRKMGSDDESDACAVALCHANRSKRARGK